MLEAIGVNYSSALGIVLLVAEPLTTLLAQTYYGHLRRALQTCIKGICTQFDQLGHAHPPAP